MTNRSPHFLQIYGVIVNLNLLRASPAILILMGFLIFLAIPTDSSAYDRWSQNDDATYCGACHGDFRASSYVSPSGGLLWGNLHNIHRFTMLSGDCDACHGNNEFPVYLASSQGGRGLETRRGTVSHSMVLIR